MLMVETIYLAFWIQFSKEPKQLHFLLGWGYANVQTPKGPVAEHLVTYRCWTEEHVHVLL